ncbi:hypothetical protein M405DRAFT_792650, partial [Rhizopogon salebrosus TDB-379]
MFKWPRTCIEYSARIPFVVRPNERNVLDQRQLEYELVEKHGMHVIRQTLADLTVSAFLDPSTLALTPRLHLPQPYA